MAGLSSISASHRRIGGVLGGMGFDQSPPGTVSTYVDVHCPLSGANDPLKVTAELSTPVGNILSYANGELNRAWEDIRERRSRQVQYFRLYMVLLGALLAVAAYGLEPGHLQERHEQLAYGLFGLVVLSLALGAGCALVLYLGYNYRGLFIAKKHIASFRFGVADALGLEHSKLEPCGESDARAIQVSEAFNGAHYWMVLPNGAVAFGVIYFLKYCWGNWQSAVDFGMLLLGLAAFYYPRVCLTFNRYMLIANRVRPGWPESRVREMYRRYSKKDRRMRQKEFLVRAFWVLFAAMSVMIGANLVTQSYFTEPVAITATMAVSVVIALTFVVLVWLRLRQLRVEYIMIKVMKPKHFIEASYRRTPRRPKSKKGPKQFQRPRTESEAEAEGRKR